MKEKNRLSFSDNVEVVIFVVNRITLIYQK